MKKMLEQIYEIFSPTGLHVKRQKLYDTHFQENATYNAEGFPTFQLPSLGLMFLGDFSLYIYILQWAVIRKWSCDCLEQRNATQSKRKQQCHQWKGDSERRQWICLSSQVIDGNRRWKKVLATRLEWQKRWKQKHLEYPNERWHYRLRQKMKKCCVENIFGGFSSVYWKLCQNKRTPRLEWLTQVNNSIANRETVWIEEQNGKNVRRLTYLKVSYPLTNRF